MQSSELKMYFVCEEQMPQWFVCYGILSNGFCFGQHICSHPSFAPSDLYYTRGNRIDALKKLFAIDKETIESETIVVRSKSDIPVWWEEHTKLQDSLAPAYAQYKELVGDTKAKVEVEFSE